jgi:two-component system, OmpR family, sensor histidine kinase ChvG
VPRVAPGPPPVAASEQGRGRWRQRVLRAVGRIGVRLLLVNGLALLVPIVGLEFARIHERQLLEALERDMKNQAALVRAMVESDLARGGVLGEIDQVEILTAAARSTRTRIRLLDAHGAVVADSHENGPPEGPEPPPPRLLGRSYRDRTEVPLSQLQRDPADPRAWPEIEDRVEVRTALAGAPAARTRLRDRDPGVFLFVAEPLHDGERVAGAVYAARSTRPVMVELYRIRSGLIRVLFVAFCFTVLVTLLLAWSISRPLGKLSRAAKRVAAGEPDVVIPVGGGGEIEELGESFAAMKERLDARLRYIEGFAADVAHEFKSPLTSIRGAAELLDEGAADEPEARARFLRNIELDVARLDRLVSRLLELSRIEASSETMAPVDLPALLDRVTERARLPEKPIELRYRRPVHDGGGSLGQPRRALRARETDLETALFNLLDNAVRFSPRGVPVEVDVAGGPAEVTIAVRDQGPGISPANLPRIFDRFFTTDADRDGTGLGLAIVETVIEAHGGSVRVETAPGEGATFTVTLPVRR